MRSEIDLTGGLSDFRDSRNVKRNMEREDSRSPLRKMPMNGVERGTEGNKPLFYHRESLSTRSNRQSID